MFGQPYKKTTWILACVALIATGLALGGCGSDFESTSTAQAAERRLINTYVIVPESFELNTDATPTIEVKEGTTVYTLVSDGTIAFIPTAGSQQLIRVTTDEIIIERPASGTLTLIRFR